MVFSFQKRVAVVGNHRNSHGSYLPGEILAHPPPSLPWKGQSLGAGESRPPLLPPEQNQQNIKDHTHLPLWLLLFTRTSRGAFALCLDPHLKFQWV